MKEKQVLGINKSDFIPFEGFKPLVGQPDMGLYLGWQGNEPPMAHFRLRNQELENDESFLQIIPYVAILYRDAIFVYDRPTGGNEERLHGLSSIGIGGHVDHTDSGDGTIEPMWIYETALRRELMEEIGLELKMEDIAGSALAMLHDPSNAVGRVHLGILHIIQIDDAMARRIMEHEAPDEIGKPRFVALSEFRKQEQVDRLETWSKIAIENLMEDYNNQTTWQNPAVRERIQFAIMASANLTNALAGLLTQASYGGFRLSQANVEAAGGHVRCILDGMMQKGDISEEAARKAAHEYRAILRDASQFQ